jgi:hypothetical protein
MTVARAGNNADMSRASELLAALTDEPTSTSELYDRVGYSTLVRIGLVPYEAFRAERIRLAGGASRRETRPTTAPRSGD